MPKLSLLIRNVLIISYVSKITFVNAFSGIDMFLTCKDSNIYLFGQFFSDFFIFLWLKLFVFDEELFYFFYNFNKFAIGENLF